MKRISARAAGTEGIVCSDEEYICGEKKYK